MSDNETSYKPFAVAGGCSILAGVLILACSVSFLSASTEYYAMIEILQEGDAVDLASSMSNVPIFCFAGSIVAAVGGIFGCLGWKLHSKALVALYAVAVLAGAGVLVVGTLTINSVLADIDAVLIPIPYEVQYTAQQQNIISFPMALYDECCEAVYNDEGLMQSQSKVCLNGNDEDCPKLPDLLPEGLEDTARQLCTCRPNDDSYTKMKSAIKERNTCNKLKTATVYIDTEIIVPYANIRLNTILQGIEGFRSYGPIDVLTMVGNPKPLGYQGGPTNDSGETGWSCGLGFIKGLHWNWYLYLDNILKPLFYGTIFLAGLHGLFLLMSFTYMLLGNEDDPFADDDFDAHVSFENSKLSRGNPIFPATSTVSTPYQGRPSLEEELEAFYLRNDPQKLENAQAMQGIIAFVHKQSREALNKRLMSKYGEDLDSNQSDAVSVKVDI